MDLCDSCNTYDKIQMGLSLKKLFPLRVASSFEKKVYQIFPLQMAVKSFKCILSERRQKNFDSCLLCVHRNR